jgi:hypothetical protein
LATPKTLPCRRAMNLSSASPGPWSSRCRRWCWHCPARTRGRSA